MQPSIEKCSNNTSLSHDISLQSPFPPTKSPFKSPIKHPANQAIINLIPKLDPNLHSADLLPQHQEYIDTDNSELTYENSQNDSAIEEILDPLPTKDLSNNTASSANRQIGNAKGVFRKFLVEPDRMEEEKLVYSEDHQTIKKQQYASLSKGETNEQAFGIVAQEEQRNMDPLENYVKGRSFENTFVGIENPEEIEDQVLKSKLMKGSKGLYLSGGKMKTRKEIEADMALELLESIDLRKLKITKKNLPDMRFSESKEFQWLCESARLDHKQYFQENIMRFSQRSESGKSTQADSNGYIGSQSSIKSERIIVKSQKGIENNEMKRSHIGFGNEKISEEILSKMNEAKRKVKEYDISKVIFKKDKSPDRRYKQNREYILLLEQCELNYYLKK